MASFNELAYLVIEKRVWFRKRRIILSAFDADGVDGMRMYQAASLFDRKEGDVFLVLPNGQEYLVSNKHGSRDLCAFGFPRRDQERFDNFNKPVRYEFPDEKEKER